MSESDTVSSQKDEKVPDEKKALAITTRIFVSLLFLDKTHSLTSSTRTALYTQ